MIRRLGFLTIPGHDPYENLALEQRLLETVEEDGLILFLWQNARTVVIGRNQCAWKECRIEALEQSGGRLARRQSGGGAVFHDLGNLNFTFLSHAKNMDSSRQNRVILRACQDFGIQGQASGRNDLTALGRKFSGSAFYTHRGRSLHHGTLLLDVDLEDMLRYLSPDRQKLRSKGVDSVRARVINLKELCPTLGVSEMESALLEAFEQEYGLQARQVDLSGVLDARWETLAARNRSWEWNYGQRVPATWSSARRFDWGGVDLELVVTNGCVSQVRVWTDSLDTQLPQALETALTGRRFQKSELWAAIQILPWPETVRTDLSSFVIEMENENHGRL